MYNLIAASFFQKKSCVLPGIGSLSLITHSSITDFPVKQIKAPVQEILFTPGTEEEKGFNEFSAISELMKKSLDEQGEVVIEGIGFFTKNASGNVQFTPVSLDEYIQTPVTANRVIREHSEHSILVGDKETTNTQMTGLLHEEEPAKYKWWIWAAVLAAAGLLLLIVYLYQYGANAFANTAP
jgi:hypothetical protein